MILWCCIYEFTGNKSKSPNSLHWVHNIGANSSGDVKCNLPPVQIAKSVDMAYLLSEN